MTELENAFNALVAATADMGTAAKAVQDDNNALTQQVADLQAQLADCTAPPPDYRPDPDAIERWSDGWQDRWYVASGGKMSKVNQQGLRIPYNVVVDKDAGTVKVYMRRSDKAYTIEGTTIPKGSWSAGLMQWKPPYQYKQGTWEFDIEMSPGRGGRMVALLWPCGDSPGWPAGGELDAPENGDDRFDCQETAITNHWDKGGGQNGQKVINVVVDLTQPVTVTYRWVKGQSLQIDFDGKQVAKFTDHIPPGPMQMCFQTAVAKGGWADTFTDASGATVQRKECCMTMGPLSYWNDPAA